MKKYTGKYLTVIDIKDVMYDIALQEIDNMSEEDARYYLLEDAIPVTGAVSNLIYYSQTEPIACEFYDDIMPLMEDVYYKSIPFEVIKTLNNITWFAWECIVFGNEQNINEIIEIAKEKGILCNEK